MKKDKQDSQLFKSNQQSVGAVVVSAAVSEDVREEGEGKQINLSLPSSL